MSEIKNTVGSSSVLAGIREFFGDWPCCEVCKKVWGKYVSCPDPKPTKTDERVSVTCFQAFGFWHDTQDIISIPKVCLKGWLSEEQYDQIVNGVEPVTTEVESFFDIDLLNGGM